jgi:hypothetical protein
VATFIRVAAISGNSSRSGERCFVDVADADLCAFIIKGLGNGAANPAAAAVIMTRCGMLISF